MTWNVRFLLALAMVAAAANPGRCQPPQAARKAAPANNTEAAIKSLKVAMAASPADARPREALALAYENAGNIELAIAQYRVLREQHPDDAEYMYRLGKAYLAAAAGYTERLKVKAPSSARVQQLIAEKLANFGSTSRAIDAYQLAVHLDPRLSGLHLALGRLYRQQGDARAALSEARKELLLVPDSAEAQAFAASLDAGAAP